MVLGLSDRFRETDSREKINSSYATVRRFIDEFIGKMGSIKCRDLINCDLSTEEGQKIFKEKNLKDRCRSCVRLCCEILDKRLEEIQLTPGA
jgi:hypothetical protein